MSMMSRKLIKDLLDAFKASEKNKTTGYDTSATVKRIENGTAWVHIPGGVDETPAKLTINANVGDIVQVRVSGGKAFLIGNGSAPPTDDTTAIKATRVANKAHRTALQASDEATEAWNYAGTAAEAAISAQTSADSASQAADRAWNHADEANQAATEAKESARSANNSANNALVQLSVVEDVAGTLRWISEHGDYVETEDDHVVSGTVYFIYQNGSYVPIAQPNPSANPSQEGWYVLDVTESQAKYIMAHLAVTSAGLWVLPVNQLAEHPLVDSEGDQIVDSSENPIVDFSEDPQHASGYKVLISGGTADPNFPIGLSIYNDEGALIANYGTTTTIGSTTGYNTFIDTTGFYVRDGLTPLAKYGQTTIFYEPGGQTVAAEIGSTGLVIKKGSIQIGSKTSASDVTNSGTYIDASGNMATSNIKAHGGTIGGFDLSPTQLNAYGTGSGAGTSDTGISRVLIQSAPGTGTNVAFGVANRLSTSDSWTWTSYMRHDGSFVSTKGTIGGWTIDATKLSRSDGNNNTVKLISTGIEITADNPYGSQQLVNQTKLSQGSILLKHYDASYMSEASLTARSLFFDTTDGIANVTVYSAVDTTPYIRVGERYTQQSTTYYRYLQLYYNLDSGACGLWHQSTNDGFNYSPFWINDNTDIVIEGDNEIDLLLRTGHTGSDLARIIFYQATDTNLVFRPNGDNKIYLGTSANRWKGIYGVTVRATDVYGNLHDTSSSDLKEKSILENHDWKIDEFIQGLKPIAFKWKEGSTGRIHMGFGAQDVAKLTKDLKIGDLSVYSAEVKTDGEFNEPYHGEEIEDSKLSWTLRYTELIAPMVMEIQRLMNRVKELEDRLNG